MHHLGYPYFASILGFWRRLSPSSRRASALEGVGLRGLLLRPDRRGGARAAVGDSAANVIAPPVFLALVMASGAVAVKPEACSGGRSAQLKDVSAAYQLGNPNAMMFDPGGDRDVLLCCRTCRSSATPSTAGSSGSSTAALPLAASAAISAPLSSPKITTPAGGARARRPTNRPRRSAAAPRRSCRSGCRSRAGRAAPARRAPA